MSFTKWFKGKKTSDDGVPVSDEELDRLQDELEEEMLADHVSLVLSRNVSMPDSDVGIPLAPPVTDGMKVKTQHLFEYHSVFHRKLWGKTSEMSPVERETVADYLDILANNIGYRGIYLGAGQLLEIASHLREASMQTSLLVEPWMTPFKLRRRDVRELYIHLCNEGLSMMAPGDGDVTTKTDWAAEIDRVKGKLNRFDLEAFSVLKSAVESLSLAEHDLKAASLGMNMDYVMACCGDRGAMSRMAGHMDFLVRNDPFISTRVGTGTEDDDVRRIVGRSWMRLAASVANSGHDPYTTATDWLPNIWLDLRYIDGSGPNTAEQRGLVIPSLSPDVDRVAYGRRVWRDDRFGEWKGLVPSRAVSTIADDDDTADGIARTLEILKKFGDDSGDNDGSLDEMAARIASNQAIMDALASLGGTSFGDEESKERSREIARAFQRGIASGRDGDNRPLPKGSTAELVGSLVKKTGNSKPDEIIANEIRILDHIGPSETIRNEGRAEDTYGRLLSPMPLSVSAIGPDELYAALQSEFPWMTEVNRMVAVAAARSARQKLKHWRLPPTLIVGPAGMGKTRWIRRVSELTAVPTHTITLAGVSHAKSVIGSERGWASARPSFMAYGFLNTAVANPIFHVDELDKTASNALEPNVQDALLPILESETARAYPDMYLLGKLDLRWSTFLFSANDLSKVSPVLTTRLKVIHLRRPSNREVEKIIETMIREACQNEEFDDGEIDAVRDGIAAKAMKIFIDSADLRDVQRHVEDEIKDIIWKPKGLHLVKS